MPILYLMGYIPSRVYWMVFGEETRSEKQGRAIEQGWAGLRDWKIANIPCSPLSQSGHFHHREHREHREHRAEMPIIDL
jgi:hypothetical protein